MSCEEHGHGCKPKLEPLLTQATSLEQITESKTESIMKIHEDYECRKIQDLLNVCGQGKLEKLL